MNSLDNKKFDILYDFIKNSSILSDSLSVLGRAKEIIQSLVECDSILLFIDEKDQDLLTAPKAFNLSQPESGNIDISYDDPIIKHILIDKQSTSRLAHKNPILPSARSEFFVPLISPDFTFGCLYIARQQEIPFSKEEIQFIELAASTLAMSLERAEKENRLEQIQEFSREWQKKYISILESWPFPAAIVNIKENVIYEVNQKMADILEYEPEELFSTPFSQICCLENQQEFSEHSTTNIQNVTVKTASGETLQVSAWLAELEGQRPRTVQITFLPPANHNYEWPKGDHTIANFAGALRLVDIGTKIAYVCSNNPALKSLICTAGSEMHRIINFDCFSVTVFDEHGGKPQFFELADHNIQQFLHPNWKWQKARNSDLGWLYPRYTKSKPSSSEPRKMPFSIKSQVSSFLLCGNNYLGTCTLQRIEENPFTEQEKQLLEKVSSQMAFSIDHIKLTKEIKNRDNEIAAIARLSDSFIKSPNLNDVLDKSCRAIKSLLTPLDCQIVKPTDDNFLADLFPWMSSSLQAIFTENHIKRILRRLLAIKQLYFLETPEQFLIEFMDKKLALEQFKNFKPSIIAPVIHKRQIFAVLVIYINQPRLNESHDLHLVKAIMNLTQNAFTKGKAAHNVSKKANDLQKLVHSTAKELKMPVEKVQNFTVLLKKDFSTIFPQKALAYIDKMSFNLHQMDGQANDLVELSRISFQNLKFQEFSSMELVKSILKSIPGLLSEKQIKIIYDEKLPWISADYEGMKRVFFNLIINAVKAAETTENAAIEIGCEEHPSFFVFYVKDNSASIPYDQRKHIFGLLPTGSNGSQVESRLATVKKIIDLHKGKIWLESNNGSGNIYKFKLFKKRKG